MNRLALFSLATALVIAASTLAEAPRVSAPAKVTTVEGITEYRLDNGLRILLAPDESKPSTTVNVTYQVGSRMEKYGETGMAHLLEHLMFKGTPHYEANSKLFLSAIYAPQNLPKLKADIADVLSTLLRDGVTEQELAEAKSGLLQFWSVGRTQDGTLATQLANQMKIGRSMTFVEAREAKVQAASVDQVNMALRKYVVLDRLVQIYAGDFAKLQPSR
jgi:predicted Zn-dependent peptidase